MLLLTAFLAILLAAVHLFAARVHVIADRLRRRWFSFSGGVAVGYIFIHILPELGVHGAALRHIIPGGPAGREVYILALIGVCAFYGLERLALTFRRPPDGDRDEQALAHRVFWVHIASFAIYNALVGYLLIHREASSFISGIVFTIALGLHFLVNDFALWQHHQDAYYRRGRWLLALAVLVGWSLGALYALPRPILAGLFAFLAGGIVINVLKEELPEERQGRFGAFLAGALLYSAILLATE